jgi:hypothetical protein
MDELAVAMNGLTGGVLVPFMRAVIAVRALVRPGPVVNVAMICMLVLGGAVAVTMRPGVGVRVVVMVGMGLVLPVDVLVAMPVSGVVVMVMSVVVRVAMAVGVVVVVRVAELAGAPHNERPA